MDTDVLNKIANATTVNEAGELARMESQRCGSIGGTFHVPLPQTSQVGAGVFIGIWGYDADWQKDYLDPDKRKHDPVPDHIMRIAHAKVHADILDDMEMTEEASAAFAHFHASRMRRTLGIPTYGPFDFDIYMSVTLARDFTPEDATLINHLVSLGEVCNRRIGQILGKELAEPVTLSPREAEVLSWIARGKSNADIGVILDISPATIDTYVRRIFGKLKVYDRISASLKGVRLGIVRL